MGLNGFFGSNGDFQQFMYRYDEATRLLGVDPLARMIFRTLLFDPRDTWNQTTLAEHFARSRPTIKKIVDRNIAGGYLKRLNNHLAVTDSGKEVLFWVHQETVDIAMGERIGFSESLIRLFRGVGLPYISPEASTICFPNDLNLF